jgi:hypothetical protein
MVYGQIHAPATLPNYVHMHLTNSNFLGILYLRNLVSLFLCRVRHSFASRAAMTARTNVQPVSLCPWVAATGNILVT